MRWDFEALSVEVVYSLVSPSASFVEKQLRLLPSSGLHAARVDASRVHNVTKIVLFDRVVRQLRHHFGPNYAYFSALHHLTRAV